jgi:hypothetical protein
MSPVFVKRALRFLLLIFWGAVAVTAMGGLFSAAKPKMDLISNEENTQFRLRRFGDQVWKDVGTGKIVTVEVQPKERYEISAKPPGYREKIHTLVEPVRDLRFTFMIEDKEAPAPAPTPQPSLPPTPQPTAPDPAISAPRQSSTPAGRAAANIGIKNHWAVIVGISEYQFTGDGGLSNLAFAENDARQFAKALEAQGWNKDYIKLLTNKDATKREIESTLEGWLTKTRPEDMIVLFWAGHGFPDVEDPEKVYFACYDTEVTKPTTGYRMDRVRTALEERRVKNVVVIADTCHAGKLVTRGDGRGISVVPAIQHMEQQKSIPAGWIFMVAADTDRKAIEHTSWQNGAFTHCLLQGLAGAADGFQSAGAKDSVVTLGELRDYLLKTMPEETQRLFGVAKHPLITTGTGNPEIWNLDLKGK